MIILLFFFSLVFHAHVPSLSFVIISSFDRSIAYLFFWFTRYWTYRILIQILWIANWNEIRVLLRCSNAVHVCLCKWYMFEMEINFLCASTCISQKHRHTHRHTAERFIYCKSWRKTMHRPEKKKLHKYSIAVLMRLGLGSLHFYFIFLFVFFNDKPHHGREEGEDIEEKSGLYQSSSLVREIWARVSGFNSSSIFLYIYFKRLYRFGIRIGCTSNTTFFFLLI